jgi:hypothetical protein
MPTFDKLNLKDQKQIVVLNAPESFEPELKSLRGVTVVRELTRTGEIEFSLAFVTKQKEVDTLGKVIAKKVQGDCGFEPVRMVAIDEDWSAVRFRRAEFIKTLTRGKEHRMSEQGKARAARK